MNKQHNPAFWLTAWLLGAASCVHADDLESASNALCEKVKACSMAQVDEADLTPEVRQMMEPMLESMCEAMRAGVQEVPTDHQLHDPAVACMRSMAELSCADFQDEQKVVTAACEEYRKIAEDMGEVH